MVADASDATVLWVVVAGGLVLAVGAILLLLSIMAAASAACLAVLGAVVDLPGWVRTWSRGRGTGLSSPFVARQHRRTAPEPSAGWLWEELRPQFEPEDLWVGRRRTAFTRRAGFRHAALPGDPRQRSLKLFAPPAGSALP